MSKLKNIKTGDRIKLRSAKSESKFLTFGKVYVVIKSHPYQFYITRDDGSAGYYSKNTNLFQYAGLEEQEDDSQGIFSNYTMSDLLLMQNDLIERSQDIEGFDNVKKLGKELVKLLWAVTSELNERYNKLISKLDN